ncbi:hypothetical protein AMAG_01951 [Allomyces macrogynus ATCC 38327]|uniref:TLDc domain-containing protein n=1 Tax=Allomyces macrogynus (strain ATCC 38327) TaxID=578462 RepID=A0A0L0S0G8_ALLM3|nr:hypothetical protein AMAG_01951 [Allomyces macrogynus ATCC 38327]|eukprot:KNE56112.1 hypothetical protein AMAG_01951 [Allomyces macrogynus ATCC 38327]
MPNVDLVDTKRYATQQPDRATSKAWDDGGLEQLFDAPNLAKTKLKQIVRKGVPDGIRSLVWPEFLKMHAMPSYDKNYAKALFRVHGQSPPDLVQSCPLFGGSLFLDKLCLTNKGALTAARLLSIVAYDYPNIDFCPFLPALVALLLHHVQPDDALGTVNLMLRRQLANPAQWAYFPTYKRDIKAFNYAFSTVVQRQLPKLWTHLERLNATNHPLWARWFCDLFIGIFDLDVIFHVLDSFLIEGYKVLFRYALALLDLKQRDALACTDWDELRTKFTLGQGAAITPADLTAKAFSYHFPRAALHAARQAHHAAKQEHREGSLPDLHDASSSAFVGRAGRPRLFHADASAFMQEQDWTAVWSMIPPRFRTHGLELAFTTRKHGRALATLYDLCREREPSLLVVETMDGYVLGAYCPVSWPLSSAGFHQFFGNGETFVFALQPGPPMMWPWVHAQGTGVTPASSRRASEVEFTKADNTESFMYAGVKELIVGGGGNGQAIWISADLTRGSTTPCATFRNPPLCPTPKFEISVLEVYSFRQDEPGALPSTAPPSPGGDDDDL